MCVIIYVPKESSISDEELLSAWTVNPDGAGYSIQKDNEVVFERGFMTFNDYYEAVKPLIGNYNLMLHFRISTSKAVNKVQTHPYKKGNVTITKGSTTRPVICMNGIVSKQLSYKDCNDTMSYIIDHDEAFANINQDILNIIEEATGAKWAVMTPDEVLLSSKFVEDEGRFYSNQNHLFPRTYYYGTYKPAKKQKITIADVIKDKKLRKAVTKDKQLYWSVLDFIEFNCAYGDMCDCHKCLKSCKTLREIRNTLEENDYAIYDPYCYCDNDESVWENPTKGEGEEHYYFDYY